MAVLKIQVYTVLNMRIKDYNVHNQISDTY